MEIKWTKGSRFTVSAETAYKELEKIKAKHGGELEPQFVVDAAKSTRSPLHGEFEWDDSAAANEYRKGTARVLMRSLVTIVRNNGDSYAVKTYSAVRKVRQDPEAKQKVYKSTEELMADPVTRAELLQQALGELMALQRKYRGLNELAIVFRAVEEAMAAAG